MYLITHTHTHTHTITYMTRSIASPRLIKNLFPLHNLNLWLWNMGWRLKVRVGVWRSTKHWGSILTTPVIKTLIVWMMMVSISSPGLVWPRNIRSRRTSRNVRTRHCEGFVLRNVNYGMKGSILRNGGRVRCALTHCSIARR